MPPTGLVAVEAQLTSMAQRHLQVRFEDVHCYRGDGWVQFQFHSLTADTVLSEEVQRLCCALVRDVTGRVQLRLAGENKESDFSALEKNTVSFAQLLRTSGEMDHLPDDLNTFPQTPGVQKMLEMLYTEVAADTTSGIAGVTTFPKTLCPTGERYDVLMKKSICVKAYSQAAAAELLAEASQLREKSKSSKKQQLEISLLQQSYSTIKLPEGPMGVVWIDTHTLAHALSSYSNSSVEAELPALWRAKSFSLSEASEVLKMVHRSLVEYWMRNTHTERTKINALSLLAIVCGDLREFIREQVALQGGEEHGPWRMAMVDVHAALQLCKQWNYSMTQLIRQDWREWDGGVFHDECFDVFTKRLHEVVRIRELLLCMEQLREKIPDTLQPEALFEHVRMADMRSTSNVEWDRCVAAFEKEVSFFEPSLRNRAKQLFHGPPCDGQLRLLQQYSALLRREGVRSAVEKDLQQVAGYFTKRLSEIHARYTNSTRRATTELQKLRASKGCQAECSEIPETAYRIFGPSAELDTVVQQARSIIDAVQDDERNAMLQWKTLVEQQCEKMIQLEDAVVVQLEPKENLLNCTVNQTLTQFLQDVRNIRAWCRRSFPAAMALNETAENTIRAAELLVIAATRTQQSVANFNTVLEQIIPCTRPMLVPAMQRATSQILYADTTRRVISLVNYQELEGLNLRFQNAVESLSAENRHIRRFHADFVSQVIALHNVDLTRHMDQWRSAVDGMRSSFEEFIFQHHYENYDDWRCHWDHQIYKALEYQYRKGLESLHENMEEFKVELVFKQGSVQFKPSFEAIREAYYIKLREFVSVPLRFRGLQPKRENGGSYEIYPIMPVVNNARIITVHAKAIELFAKLSRVRKAFRSHVVIGLCGTNGSPDLDTIVEWWTQHSSEQFTRGFQTVKERLDKLNKIEDVMKVDCFAVSTIPVKASMEEQLHRLEESLLNAMRKAIQLTLNDIDKFVFTASNVVERTPTTMDEVGQANKAYRDYVGQLGDFEKKFKHAEEMSKELRQHSGAQMEMGATRTRWEHLREAMSSHSKVIEAAVAKMRVSLDGLIQKFLKDVQRFSTNWNKQKALLFKAFREKKPESVVKLLDTLKDQMQDLEDIQRQGRELESKCEYFNQPKPNFTVLEKTVEDVASTSGMWALYDRFQQQLAALRGEDWLTFRSHTYQFDDFCKEWNGTLSKLVKKESDSNVIAQYLLDLLHDWSEVLPLLKFVRGDGWMTEHWNELFRLLDIPKGMTSTALTFGDILDHYQLVLEKQKDLKQLHARAQGEIQIREALQELRTWALEANFTLLQPTDGPSTVKLITDWKEVMTQVSDNQALVSSLKDSPFYVNFADEAGGWEVKLVSLSESLVLLNSIQRKWTYLEPIFARGALPQEQARFKRVDKEFVGILHEVEADPRVMSLASQVDFNDKLKGILEQIDRCQKSLMEYLDAKRDKLPRFYFISDEDLLEILGHSQNPSVIQTHLKKLFMGIHAVEFNAEQTAITHMVSADREQVMLREPVSITDKDVEDWLIRLDSAMKATLFELLARCVQETDHTDKKTIEAYPSQVLQVAMQVQYTQHAEAAITQGKLPALLASLKEKLNRLTSLGADADGVTSLKVKALILDVIRSVEVTELLMEKRVQQTQSWLWQKQLRYTMDSQNNCLVHMVDTAFPYTYEYQGNAAKLVHTPLTDKCYLVLMKGMGLGYGGNPYGPAGTGKTESVKALGSAMGRQVLVFNCDEGIDFKAMGRIFVGIVKCGAWGCFDEFNRLKIDQLSAISQMIQVIQEALKNKEPNCPLLSKSIDVNPNAGIFVTLNPAGKGYGGRTKLPDNLKQLFREVAMSVPDNELITSTMLLSEGFTHARALAKNVVELYKLCGQLLSRQQHYDWGLRPLKAVLRLGGTLVQRWKKEHPGKTATETEEAELMLQSLNINTLSKLTFDDARLFSGLLRDIFPGVESREITYTELEEAVKTATEALGLCSLRSQRRKVLQLYEAMNQRMGVVLVGPSGSGKSTLIRILRKALEVMGVTVPLHVMNPKAMPRRQLLGYMDPDTREWYDGVLTAAARDAVKQPKEARPWILCDGDIDPEWIESLNSVLDDNKLLTMPNGVRIQFGSNVNFLFETHSLEYASPATVSRMGVLFFSEKDVDLQSVADALLQKESESVQKVLVPLVKKYVVAAIDEAMNYDELSVPTTRMGLLNACLSHVRSTVNEADFVFALIRGLGSALTPSGAQELAKWVYGTSGQKPVSKDRPLNSYWDAKAKRAAEFTADLSASIQPADFLAGHPPTIATAEVQRLMAVLAPLVRGSGTCAPIFVVGPEGCGKGSILRHCFTRYAGNTRTSTINCSAQTTSTHVVQKLEQLCTLYSTNNGRVYRPKEGDRLVLILKNVNLPKPDKYGTVELHSFLQQLLLYHGFYNKELEWIGIERVQLVASMNPAPSAGRYPVAPRLLAVVNIVSMTYSSKSSLQQIYTAYWGGLLKATTIGKGKEYDSGAELAQFVINVFDKIRHRFEGEEYAHFYFCPRHITNWVSNALLYKIDARTTLPAVLAYEANRIFADCLPRLEDRTRAEKIFAEQLATIGYSAPAKEERYSTMYVTWFSEAAATANSDGGGGGGGAAMKQLEQKKYDDVKNEVENALLRYSREFKDLAVTVIPEVVSWITRVDRVLLRPGGHVILVGHPGDGRREAITLAAYMQRMEVATLNMTQDYGVKSFRSDLRGLIQRATTQNTRVVLVLEDHNLVSEDFLELVNGLVCSGEVPGLFTPEEMETMLSPLREEAANDGFMGPIYTYFIDRLQRNLRIGLVMDNRHELFLVRLQSNPGLLSRCELLWMGGWSAEVTKAVCKTQLKDTIATLEADAGNKGFHLHREMYTIHEGMGARSTPKEFQVLMDTFRRIIESKSKSSEENLERLQTGLAKLKEAEASVDTIKKDIAKKKGDVEAMQKEADRALNEIEKSMKSSQEQRDQAAELQDQLKEEHEDIIVKRAKVEEELSSIKPMMEAARDAVSTIRGEQLSEIRSLKAPPEPIRDVLEGVLALLGVNDVSWQSMRQFLGERGAKERILEFNVKSVTPAIRSSVGKLLQQKATSFKPEVIHRASVAAAPMAEWVKAMVEYSTIMERIAPLTRQLEQLETNQKEGEERLEALKKKLKKIDKQVEELRDEFSQKCKEAERLRNKLQTAQNELTKAQDLLDKLSGEKTRWADDAAAITEANRTMPKRALVSAAFLTYMGGETEDVRQQHMKRWSDKLGFAEPVSLTRFMRSERELLQYKAEGLPGDELSLENAVVVLDTVLTPLVIDPANQAVEWVKEHLRTKNVVVEVASLHDERFPHTLELAIRFGKTLLVTEVNSIEPLLYPVLRRDLTSAGAKRVVQVGNKSVDWQDAFRILLFTRRTDLTLPPSAAALVAAVNFSVTSMGLESQLLGLTIQHERPELEEQKVEQLQKEEALKLELSKLEERLLMELANSHGDLLENVQLITSLNEVKTQASTIQEALAVSKALQKELDDKREVYRPFAHHGATLYFLIKDLERLNRMYQFGLNDFIAMFTRTLQEYKGEDTVSKKVPVLVQRFAQTCFHRVSLGLFKKDRLIFGLHLLHGFHPESFPQDQWEGFTGAVKAVQAIEDRQVPSWAPPSCKAKLAALLSCASGAELQQKWQLSDSNRWTQWMNSASPDSTVAADASLSIMEQLLLVSTFRPDRLPALSLRIILQQLKLDSLVPAVSLEDTVVGAGAGTPVVLITSSGADPSMEVQEIATRVVGKERFTQIALGGGQTDEAMQQLRRCAAQGCWIFLKNLHLVLDWAAVLEKELCAMTAANPDFRLIITTEPHDSFPTVLLRMAVKVTVESPPGVKQNMMRTYRSWDAPFIESQQGLGAQLLCGLAWFHAVIQERRTFVPQGWVKYYEFSPADLKAATDILCTLARQPNVDWQAMKGLLKSCVYGGRLENTHDDTTLSHLLCIYFTEETLIRQATPLFGNACIPSNAGYDVVRTFLQEKVPDVDPPEILYLPHNADRAVQEHAAAHEVEELRTLSQRMVATQGSTDGWRALLGPVLEMWASCGVPPSSGAGGPRRSFVIANDNPDPMEVFFTSEANLLGALILELRAFFEDLRAVADGTMIPTSTLRAEAFEMIGGRMPSRWLDRVEGGPKEAKLWLAFVVRKYNAVLMWLKQPLPGATMYDLSTLLRPQTFFNALRQHTARQTRAPLVDLVLVASAGGGGVAAGLPVSVVVKGSTILIQGAIMGDGGKLTPVAANSPSSTPLTQNVTVGWLSREKAAAQTKGYAAIPVYATAERETSVFSLYVPVTGPEEEGRLAINGVACFLLTM